jgi:protein AFG1
VYYDPLDESTRSEVQKLFAGLTNNAPIVEGRQLDIWGRKLRVPKSAGRVAMFTFEDLCGSPLSAADYIEVTRHFGTVFLCDVKKMGLGGKDKARRFITFIDGALLFLLPRRTF